MDVVEGENGEFSLERGFDDFFAELECVWVNFRTTVLRTTNGDDDRIFMRKDLSYGIKMTKMKWLEATYIECRE